MRRRLRQLMAADDAEPAPSRLTSRRRSGGTSGAMQLAGSAARTSRSSRTRLGTRSDNKRLAAEIDIIRFA